VKALDGVVLTA